ncbi:MAG: carboxypeptidase-like regulatory domain-containing protein, partial [Acidobacteriota bacterium]
RVAPRTSCRFPVLRRSTVMVWSTCLMLSVNLAVAQPRAAHLRGAAVDENGSPVRAVEVVLQPAGGQTQAVYTDAAGRFEFSALASGEYRLSLAKSGFFHISQQPIQIKEGENEISVVLNHETELHENVEVSSTTQVIKPQDTAHEEALVARAIRDIPVPATHDLNNSLPALPQVVRDNSGNLHVAGGRAGEAQYILDGFDIGDPVSGELTARINVDSVRVAEVETGRYATQYGRAGVGTLALDTLVGDDQWRESMTNFIPGVNVDSGVRFGNWYPRFTVSGPLQKGHAWFSEALSIQHTLKVIKDLPQNGGATTQWSGDNLLRAQVNLSPTNMLQGSFLKARGKEACLATQANKALPTNRDHISWAVTRSQSAGKVEDNQMREVNIKPQLRSWPSPWS